MAPNNVLLFAALFATAAALVTDRSSAFLNSAMQPDRVAHTLTSVEREWEAQAWAFADCTSTGADANCLEAPGAFHTSCAKVAGAIFSASGGVLATTQEYMNDVCEISRTSASYPICSTVSKAMISQMSASELDNRENSGVHADKACDSLWTFFLEKEKAAKEKVLAEAKDTDEGKKDEKQVETKEDKKAVKKSDEKAGETKAKTDSTIKEAKKGGKEEKQKEAIKHDKKKPADLNKKMPLKAAEQGFKGKKVQHKDGKTETSDWRSEYGPKVAPEKAAPKKSGSIRSVLSLTMLIVPAVSLLM